MPCDQFGRRLRCDDVLFQLSDLFQRHGIPQDIRSDSGLDFTARAVRRGLKSLGVGPLCVESGCSWESSYIESFNGRFGGELPKPEFFDTLGEAKYLIEHQRCEYHTFRPHESLRC